MADKFFTGVLVLGFNYFFSISYAVTWHNDYCVVEQWVEPCTCFVYLSTTNSVATSLNSHSWCLSFPTPLYYNTVKTGCVTVYVCGVELWGGMQPCLDAGCYAVSPSEHWARSERGTATETEDNAILLQNTDTHLMCAGTERERERHFHLYIICALSYKGEWYKITSCTYSWGP